MSKIEELRRVTQSDLTEPPIYKPFRGVSVYVTRALIRTPVSPDLVTLTWALLLCVAAYSFSLGTWAGGVWGGLAIAIYYVLDCVDGELARARQRGSKIGSQLEQICHWITHGVLLSGIAFGQLATGPTSIVLFWFAAALIGDYTFHFTFYQLNLLFDRSINYGVLHLLTRLLYLCMPINTNLFLVGSFFGWQWYMLVVWAVVSNVGWLVVFALYYYVEKVTQREAARESRGA